MSDLVKRLRAWHTPGETITGDVALYLEAADRIEALEAALDQVVKFPECATAEPTLRQMIRQYYIQGLQPDTDLALRTADRFIRALGMKMRDPSKPVMAASEKAAEVVSGWSDAKKDYAGRAVPSILAEGQDK